MLRVVTTVLDLLGVALVVTAAAVWSLPLALLVAGCAALLMSWRLSR